MLTPEFRSAYRIVALAGGLHGRIIKHELCFTIFEGTLIVIAMFGLNDAHPGRLPAPESAPVTEIVTFDSSSEFHAKPKETGRFYSFVPRRIADKRSKA